MQQTYTHILTFLFRHQFYGDELFRSLHITLGESAAKQIRDLGIIIKPFPGGWHLLASDPELLKNNNDAEPLRLYLFCTDPYYINYTSLTSYNPSQNLLYFNNLSVNKNENGNGFYLHRTEFAGETELFQLSNGKASIPSYSDQKKYVFTNAAGIEISSDNIRQSGNSNGDFILTNLPEGAVLVRSETKEVAKVYYKPESVWKKPFGIIEIYTNSLIEHNLGKDKVEYEINFDNRKTVWKYFLVDPVYKKFNNLSIINKGKDQIFNPPHKEQVNNTEALVFESKNRIPLVESSDENYQLVDSYEPENGKGKIILKNLPKASPEQLLMYETKSTETIYSHIYI